MKPKEHLTTGRIAVIRNGNVYLVHYPEKLYNLKTGKTLVGSYNDDLTYYDYDFDIMAIYENPFENVVVTDSMRIAFGKIPFSIQPIWQRTEIPEYTMEEAIEKMGHEFKLKK